MRVFLALLCALCCSFINPVFAQNEEAAVDVTCQGDIHLNGGKDQIYMIVACDDPSVNEARALTYARNMLDLIGLRGFTGLKSATPLGPIGPIEANTSSRWAMEFFIPLNI